MRNKSRYFALFVVVAMLTLSVQVVGQTPSAAPQPVKKVARNPPSTNILAAPSSPAPPSEKETILQAVSDVAKAAIEANRVTMEQTAAFYQQRVGTREPIIHL